ncbi:MULTISPECIES: type III pantothenate kinase [Geobacillus]|jgi:type III pantothenate kinase|uniref:Type III pantothenate kinase n=2 Tax=Geobacillus thermodenitrificans TaxID=33940 RepID=COAX_GEOTN|nr:MULTISPECIES: type III pantothenate kinase [Geobacillus]A4IJE6.1 RecName: Full=Type III pantothenate kinase; AltName: Full=PanK-III; AltName: Full=Pantothenic acid kinase [Geobacillus thermodenitrificans NG80-2]ABO65450.1 Pantothenate kinase [Geobacillus thermodenitrificans NG80-2]ARP41083.1 Type III pantothenate kinase [Geobacillus thermodenitrificans]ATO37457.1 pantothenate kinase [Geobacillus thermodenitrificans]KQB94994.1 Type III pantothenate kinase [Geobacillus sp. PA-3]MEC5189648.1 
MIFVLDVGNTNTVLGVYDGDELKYHWRIETSRAKTEDEYGMTIKALLNHVGLQFSDIRGMIISSVVPPIMFALERMCLKYFHIKPLIVGPGIKTGLDIKYENPREVGADRIVNAVAGIHLYGSPLIIVDFGTATTYCYINEHKQYMGGAIAPGIMISTEALFARAAKLPRIEIARPDDIVGKNTVSAMQAGILYGYVGQVEGIVSRMKAKSKVPPKVIATGGLAPLIASESSVIDVVDPFLTLTGLKLLYEKNTEKKG